MARYRRFRRRRRGTWFPLLGTGIGGEPGVPLSYITLNEIIVSTPNTDPGEWALAVLPLTYDYPQEAPYADETVEGLSEIVGNEAVIDAMVGSITVVRDVVYGQDATAAVEGPGVVDAFAGIFVARAGDPSDDSNLPLGWLTLNPTRQLSFNPGIVNTAREPWMWRRWWRLGWAVPGGQPGNTTNPYLNQRSMLQSALTYPVANWMYANSEQGCGVRVKTRRRIGNDDRLFWIGAARQYANSTEPAGVAFNLDVRIHGALRRAHNRSAF